MVLLRLPASPHTRIIIHSQLEVGNPFTITIDPLEKNLAEKRLSARNLW